VSLADLAKREAGGAVRAMAENESIVDRLSLVVLPYAVDLGVAPDVARLLVRAIAASAVGIMREIETERVAAGTVKLLDERG
jgi:hypothetical protein